MRNWILFSVGILILATGVVMWVSNNHVPVWSIWANKNRGDPPAYYEIKEAAYYGLGLIVIGVGLVGAGVIKLLGKQKGGGISPP